MSNKLIGDTENKFIEYVKFKSTYMLHLLTMLDINISSNDVDVVEMLGKLKSEAAEIRKNAIDYEEWRKQRGEMPEIKGGDQESLLIEFTETLKLANKLAATLDRMLDDDDQNSYRLKRIK